MNSAHASILPRILDGIGKHNLAALNVEPAVQPNVLLDVRAAVGNGSLAKDFLAVGHPVVRADALGAHGIGRLGHLEPAELGAELPSPLTHVAVDVIGHILDEGSLVLSQGETLIGSVLLDHWELLLRVGSCDTQEHVAEFDTLAVLNRAGERVSYVGHEIGGIEVLNAKEGIDVIVVRALAFVKSSV